VDDPQSKNLKVTGLIHMNTNIVILEGRLTRDPETKEIGTNNTQVTNFGMAVNRPQKRGDEWIDNTGFYEVQAWQRNAELVNAATIGRQLMKPTDGAKKSVADDDDIPF
jgi:hypothetical protein